MEEDVPVAVDEEVVIGGCSKNKSSKKRHQVFDSVENCQISKRPKISIFGVNGPPKSLNSSTGSTGNNSIIAYSLAGTENGKHTNNSVYDEETENEDDIDSQATEEFDSQATEVESRATTPSEPDTLNPDLDPLTGDFVFRTLQEHIVVKKDARLYRCDICSHSYRQPFGLKRHFVRSHIDRKYISAADRHTAQVNGHPPSKTEQMNRSGRDVYRCFNCSVNFADRKSLKEHVQNHHLAGSQGLTRKESLPKSETEANGNSDVIPNEEIEEMFECIPCGITFNSREKLNSHRQQHTLLRPHICKFCSKGFATLKHKQRHELIHAKGARFPCKLCKMDFTKRIDLVEHHNIKHADVLKQKCTYCKEIFAQEIELEQHLVKVHSSTLLQNKKQKNGDKVSSKPVSSLQYVCSVCKRRFLSDVALNDHMKNIHSIGRTKSEEPSRIRPSNLRPDPNKPGIRRENIEENFYQTLASRISENLNFYLDGRSVDESDSDESNYKDLFDETKVPKSSLPWSIYNYPLTIDITHMMQVFNNRQNVGAPTHIRDFSLPFQDLTDMSEQTLCALGLNPLRRNEETNERSLLQKFFICNICKGVFKSDDAVITHQIDDHPGIEGSFFEYDGVSHVPNELLPAPVSTKGILSTVRLKIEGYDDCYRCTKCFCDFTDVVSLHVHAAECGKELLESSSSEKSKFRQSYLRRFGPVFSIYEKRRYRSPTPDLLGERASSGIADNTKSESNAMQSMVKMKNTDRTVVSKPRQRAIPHGKSSDRPFQCRYCFKAFPSQHNHRRHERIHERGAPFLCRVCGSGFTQRNDIISHFRRYHKQHAVPKEDELMSEQRLRSIEGYEYNREGEDRDLIVKRTVQDMVTTVICWDEEEQEMALKPPVKEVSDEQPEIEDTNATVKVEVTAFQENESALLVDSVAAEISAADQKRTLRYSFNAGPQKCKTCGAKFRTHASLRRHWSDECNENPLHFQKLNQRKLKIKEEEDQAESEESTNQNINESGSGSDEASKDTSDSTRDSGTGAKEEISTVNMCHICKRVYNGRIALKKHLARTSCAIKNKEMLLAAQTLSELANSSPNVASLTTPKTEANDNSEKSKADTNNKVSVDVLKTYEDSIDSAVARSVSQSEAKVEKSQTSEPAKVINRRFICGFCDIEFSSNRELLHHRVAHHFKKNEPDVSLVSDEKSDCPKSKKPLLVRVMVPEDQESEKSENILKKTYVETVADNEVQELLAEAADVDIGGEEHVVSKEDKGVTDGEIEEMEQIPETTDEINDIDNTDEEVYEDHLEEGVMFVEENENVVVQEIVSCDPPMYYNEDGEIIQTGEVLGEYVEEAVVGDGSTPADNYPAEYAYEDQQYIEDCDVAQEYQVCDENQEYQECDENQEYQECDEDQEYQECDEEQGYQECDEGQQYDECEEEFQEQYADESQLSEDVNKDHKQRVQDEEQLEMNDDLEYMEHEHVVETEVITHEVHSPVNMDDYLIDDGYANVANCATVDANSVSVFQ